MALATQIGNKIQNDKNRSLGFTYLGMLMLIAISGIAMAGVGIVWHQDMQREREKELLFIGDAYRRAIGSYYEGSPNGIKQYPKTLDELKLDTRFPIIKRHIRKLYPDPMRQSNTWGLEEQQGRIIGVYSLSEQKKIKKFGFQQIYETFVSTSKYDEWKFIYTPGSLAANASPSTSVVTDSGP